MSFHSILFNKLDHGSNELVDEKPPYFSDLNLDQVVDAITADKLDYGLNPFFFNPLKDLDTILYRQEIAKDLEQNFLLELLEAFAQKMVSMRRILGMVKKLYYRYHQEGWYLHAVKIYGEAVSDLYHDLLKAEIHSRGLRQFREYLKKYVTSDGFQNLKTDTNDLAHQLSKLKYAIQIKGLSVRVRKFENGIDYSVDVENTFEKFKQGAVKDHLVKLPAASGMNHVEAKIVEMVAKLYPKEFSKLDQFCEKYEHFLDDVISDFDREIQFFISYLRYINPLKNAGLKFCYPQIMVDEKHLSCKDAFDLALAKKLVNEEKKVVCNDFHMKGQERIFIVSGPNQGGKTTFARTFGQLHHLACLGLPIPGKKAQIFLFDQLFTHFEKEEDIRNLRGKLQDDLVRIYEILERATSKSIIIINEIFTSTSLQDAIYLSKKIMEEIIQKDTLCVCVSFIDELATMSPKTVSMVSTIIPENPAQRTFKILRRPADGLAYAISIAEKYHLTYDHLKERIKP